MRDAGWRTWAQLAVSGAVLVAMWVVAQGLVTGTLAYLQVAHRAERAESFSWVGPQLVLPDNQGQAVQLVGRTPADQMLTLSCGAADVDTRVVTRGFFDVTLRPATNCAGPASVTGSLAMRPGDAAGSRDQRVLSYQLFGLWLGAINVPLDALPKESGVYGVEPNLDRLTPSEVLGLSWDAYWYADIVRRGYHFDGDGAVQQNVAWAFLAPYLGKAVVAISGLPAREALPALNRWLVLLAMAALFGVGRRLDVPPMAALAPPALLAFSPFNLFLFGGFSEALFVALGALLALATISRWWWAAAILVGLMAATRFVGVVAVVPVAAYWLAQTSTRGIGRRAARLAGFAAAGLAGIVADAVVKWSATGHPLAAFQIRGAWQVPGWEGVLPLLDFGSIGSGNFFPLVTINALLALAVAVMTGAHWRLQGFGAQVAVAGIGLSVVAATIVLNPDVNAAGRYLLPLIIALPGVLAMPAWRGVAMGGLVLWGTMGSAGMGLVLARVFLGHAPY